MSGLSNLPAGVVHGDPYFYDEPYHVTCPGCEERIQVGAGESPPAECSHCGREVPHDAERDFEPDEPDWDSMPGGADAY